MKKKLALVVLLLVALPSWALDYRSMAEPAVLYDAPSQKGKQVFVISRSTPIEVVVAVESWLKVRDVSGGIAWVEKRYVSDKRTLQVTAPRAQVRSQPDLKSALVFEAEKDVVLELADPQSISGWVKVRHRGGQTGYVRVIQVWGL